LFVAALLVLGVAAFLGDGSPWRASLLVLVIPLAFCMNRYVFFPNETGVTADAAVIFAAVVACHNGAQWVGPLMVALLVGPLDATHWRQRAYVRMAYNSGSTTLVTAGAVLAFEACLAAFGSSSVALLAAAGIATLPYVVAESLLGVGLVTLLGERLAPAVRQQLPLNAIALPLGLVGALAGVAALGLGWWAAVLLLLPTPLVPELIVVTLRRRFAGPTSVSSTLLMFSAVALALSVAGPGRVVRDFAGCAAVLCFSLAESPPTRTAILPPLVVAAVVAPIGAFSTLPPASAILFATLAGLLYLFASSRQQQRSWWAFPIVGLTTCLGRVWAMTGAAGALLLLLALAGAIILADTWGPPPWSSRLIARLPRTHHPALLIVLAATLCVASIGTVAMPDGSGAGLALAAATLLEAEVLVVAFAVRAWRFSPRRLARDLATLVLAAAAALVSLAIAGVIAAAIVMACSCAASVVALPLAGRAIEASTFDRRVTQHGRCRGRRQP